MEKKQVKIAGIRQNCFALDCGTDTGDLKKKSHVKKYYSLEEKKLRNGYIEELETKDYPINSDSITSYADGADYRRDPAGAVANAPKRVNLGDVSQVQDFLSHNPQEAVRLLRDVNKRLGEYLQKNNISKGNEDLSKNEKGGSEK